MVFFNAKEWTYPLGVNYKVFDFKGRSPKKNFYWSNTGVSLRKDVERWLNAKNWYCDRGIAWRRGSLLFGLPGTGKSKLVSEVCFALSIPLRIFDISGMSNSEFIKFFGNSPSGSVLLIEDIDSIFEGRENILQKDSALTRSGRMDNKFELTYLNENGKKFIAENILFGYPELIQKVLSLKDSVTAADFENICIELAKEEFWRENLVDNTEKDGNLKIN